MYSSRGMSLADVEWLPEEFGVEKSPIGLHRSGDGHQPNTRVYIS